MSTIALPTRDSVESMLAQLSLAFTVSDLMTPSDALIRASNQEEAAQLYQEHQFDVIPHPGSGPISGFYYCENKFATLDALRLISDSTSLIDLLSLLSVDEFFFVLSGREISGFVHFSDLNKPLIRTPLFMLLEATERHLISIMRASLTEQELKSALSEKEVKSLEGRLKKAALKRANTNLWEVLGLRDILEVSVARKLAYVSEHTQITNQQIEAMIDVRNAVAHGKQLVDSHDAVKLLVKVKDLCTQLRAFNGASKAGYAPINRWAAFNLPQ